MMNCEQATRLMSDGRERDLSLRERAAIKIHTLMCDGCSNFNAQIHDISQISRRYAKEREGQEDQANTGPKGDGTPG